MLAVLKHRLCPELAPGSVALVTTNDHNCTVDLSVARFGQNGNQSATDTEFSSDRGFDLGIHSDTDTDVVFVEDFRPHLPTPQSY